MPYDRATETLHLDVERVVALPNGVFDVYVRAVDGVDVTAGGFPAAPVNLTVLPVPGFRGWVDVRFDAVLDDTLQRYEWERTYEGGSPQAPVSAGLRTWVRVPARPGVPATYRVRAVNVSGAGAWSVPYTATAGFLDGVLLGTWGTMEVDGRGITWFKPDRYWGEMGVGGDAITWRVAPEVTGGWGAMDVRGQRMEWLRVAPVAVGWGAMAVDGDALEWREVAPVGAGWGVVQVGGNALAWVDALGVAAGWGTMETDGNALSWEAALSAAGWGSAQADGEALQWRKEPVLAGWGSMAMDGEALTWRVS